MKYLFPFLSLGMNVLAFFLALLFTALTIKNSQSNLGDVVRCLECLVLLAFIAVGLLAGQGLLTAVERLTRAATEQAKKPVECSTLPRWAEVRK